jgi:hypothetical protein
MAIRNFLAEAWMQLSGAGLLVLAAILMVTPFIISIISNIGRRVPATAQRHVAARRRLPRSHSAVSRV